MAQIIEKLKFQINQIIDKIKAMPEEKLIAYGAIILGLILILIAILIW